MSYIIMEEPISKGVICATLANSLKKQYYCEKCNSGFSKLSYLRLHMKLHAFVCSLCSRRYFYKPLLRRHLRIEHKFMNVKYKEEKIECKQCSKIFFTKREYKYHIWTHYLDKFFCLKSDSQRALKKKECKFHREKNKLEKCGVCGKEVKQLQSHMLVHQRESFLCKICDKYFCSRSDLRKHLVIHLKMKQHACPVCGKSFTQKCHLIVHTRTHTTGKTFKCKICHLSFIRSDALTMHEKTVHGGKEAQKFSCDKCRFTASTLGCVNYHKNLFHREIFQCRVCCAVFMCQKSLERHSWTHSEQKPFRCSLCSQQYATKSTLTKHVKRVHS